MAKEPEEPKSDILDDALKIVGGAEAQVGLPTPAEMEALEAGTETEEGAETAAAEEPAKEETSAEALKGIDIDLLQEKVAKNEELSEDEKAALAAIEVEVEKPEPKPTKTYTIAGKTYTFEEMEKKYRQETENEDTEFSVAGLEKTVDAFARAQNREAAHVATAEKQKVLAQEAKQIETEKQEVAAQRARNEALQESMQREKARVQKLKEKLTAKANSPLTETDTVNAETGITDAKKLIEYQQKVQAQEELASIAEDEKEIEQQEAQISAQLAYTELKGVQLAHPQYRTSEDLLVIARKISQHQPIDAKDKAIFLALRSMFNEASTANLTVEDVYESRKLHGQTLPEVAPPTQALKPGLKQLKGERTQAQLVEAIKRYKARVAKNPNLADSSGGGQRGKDTRRPAQIMNAQERASRADAGDKFAREWWRPPKS